MNVTIKKMLRPQLMPVMNAMLGIRTKPADQEINLSVTGGRLPFTAYLRRTGPGQYVQLNAPAAQLKRRSNGSTSR